MGMPVTVHIIDDGALQSDIDAVFDYFTYVDGKFSTYKSESEISLIRLGTVQESEYSSDMKLIFDLSEETKKLTNGFFDIRNSQGEIDPSGIVKGWAIHQAAMILDQSGFLNFYIEAGGDIQVRGKNEKGEFWNVGIQDPFDTNFQKIVKKIYLKNNEGVATSGISVRGNHIYNPKNNDPIHGIMCITVIGPNIYEADRFATAAFAMGKDGINFIEALDGFEAYMISDGAIATYTGGFEIFLS